MRSIHLVSGDLFLGKITPEEALRLFRTNQVTVEDMEPPDNETATWEQLEDYGATATDLFHNLSLAGADGLIPEFDREIARAVREGRIE